MSNASVRLALLMVIAMMAQPAEAEATSYLAPYRPLTDEERILNSCEFADAIVLARIGDRYDYFFPSKDGDGRSGAMMSVASFTVIRPLKGQLAPKAVIAVDMSRSRALTPEQAREPRILFLRKNRLNEHYKRSAQSPLPRWSIMFAPDFIESSVGMDGRNEHSVRRAIQFDEPESLATLSDAVLIANVIPPASACEAYGTKVGCWRLTLVEQLYGAPVSLDLQVLSPAPGYVETGRHLLFLRAIRPGVYETIGLAAGAQKVEGKMVGRQKRDLAKVRRRIAAVERARGGRIQRQDL